MGLRLRHLPGLRSSRPEDLKKYRARMTYSVQGNLLHAAGGGAPQTGPSRRVLAICRLQFVGADWKGIAPRRFFAQFLCDTDFVGTDGAQMAEKFADAPPIRWRRGGCGPSGPNHVRCRPYVVCHWW